MDYHDNFQEMVARYNRELMRTYEQQAPTPRYPLYEQADEPAAPPSAQLPQKDTAPPPEEIPVPPPVLRPADAVPAEVGYLQVWVTTARSALPVEGAHVTVSRGEGAGREVNYIGLTDSSGYTPVIPLSAAGRQLSLSPQEGEAVQPYTAYNIEVAADGYYRVENVGLPMYGGVLATQPVRLIPLPEFAQAGETLSYESGAPDDLHGEGERA